MTLVSNNVVDENVALCTLVCLVWLRDNVSMGRPPIGPALYGGVSF